MESITDAADGFDEFARIAWLLPQAFDVAVLPRKSLAGRPNQGVSQAEPADRRCRPPRGS